MKAKTTRISHVNDVTNGANDEEEKRSLHLLVLECHIERRK